MKIYNKLVRDKIPQVIGADGRKCEVRIAGKEEHYKLLEAKLQEEMKGFLEDKNLEELADVMEVPFGLEESMGFGEEELLRKRGRFYKNSLQRNKCNIFSDLILKSVYLQDSCYQ